MWIKRTTIWLFAAIAWIAAADRVVAQPAHSNLNYQVPNPTYENGSAPFSDATPGPMHGLNPFHPVGFEPQFDWFAPAETSGYGRGPRPRIGYFFSYERLFWAFSSPESAFIGSTNPAASTGFSPDGPTLDNSFIGATGAWGNRWELGYVDTDDYGWLVSVLDHVSQSHYRVDQNPIIPLLDPTNILSGLVEAGDPPVIVTIPFAYSFAEARMKNITQLNGVEVTRFYRARRLHSGAYFELLYGARWLQINDTFEIQADGNGLRSESISINDETFTYSANVLDASIWSNRALNNLVGPQIGVRFFQQRGRWVTSFEARFLAAANFQNMHMKTVLAKDRNVNQIAGNVPSNWRGLGSDIHQYTTTASPVGEFRVNVSYQVTRSVGLKVGYTGLVVGNISRASNRIDYDSVNLIGILPTNYNQIFFSNGINVGVEINR